MAIAEETVRRPRRVFYGWIIVAAAMGVQALQGALLSRAFGAYIVLLQEEFGWSRAVLSGAFSLQQVEHGILGPVQGWLIDRLGPRAVMRVGIVLFGAGFMLLSRIDSVASFYLAFVVIAVGSSLSGVLSISVTIINWFAKRRSTAMGLVQTGLGIGGLLVPAVAWSLNTYGWRATAFASGVITIVVGLPLSQIMRHRPEQYGYLPDGANPEATDTPETASGRVQTAPRPPVGGHQGADFTVTEALRAPAFWFVALGHGSALLVVSAVMVHLVAHLKESLGYSVTQGSTVVSLLTAMTMTGQVVGGMLGDRFSRRWLVTYCMIGHAVAFIILAYATALWMVIVFAVLHGLSWGIRGPQMQAIRADYFGRTSFGTIAGFSSLIVTVGAVSGPLVAGILADRTGNYREGFTILAILAGMGSIFWVLARPPKPPRRPLKP